MARFLLKPATEPALAPASMTVRLSTDVGLYFLAQGVPALLGFLAVGVYTRLLSPAEFGLYSLVSTTVGLVSSVGFGWLSLSAFRYFAQSKRVHGLAPFLTTLLSIWCALFALFLPLWLLVLAVMQPNSDAHTAFVWQLGILVVGAQTLYTLTQRLLQADMQSSRYALNSLAMSGGVLVLAALMISQLRIGAAGILLAKSGVAVVLILILLPWFHHMWRDGKREFSAPLVLKFIGYGLPLVGMWIGRWVLDSADRYILQWFFGQGEVGIYSAGYTLANQSIVMLFLVLMLATEPAMVQLYEEAGSQSACALLEDTIRAYLVTAIPVVLAVVIFAESIGSVAFGAEFHRASLTLPWIAGGALFAGLAELASRPFGLTEQTGKMLWVLLPIGVLNVYLNLVLVPNAGAIGAAQATFIAYLAYPLLTGIVSTRLLAWRFPWLTLVKTVVCAGAIYLVALLTSSWASNAMALVSQLVLSMVVYLLALAVLRERIVFLGFHAMRRALDRITNS